MVNGQSPAFRAMRVCAPRSPKNAAMSKMAYGAEMMNTPAAITPAKAAWLKMRCTSSGVISDQRPSTSSKTRNQ